MGITRRQFVTRLSALAAAAGLGQADIARIAETFAYGTVGWGGTGGKPIVVWLHGAECTGCSTSALGLYEELTGTAILSGAAKGVSTLGAVRLATGTPELDRGDLSLKGDLHVDGDATALNIADVLLDVIDLQYHETVMGMGGDLAYKWLLDFKAKIDKPFVLVVEGALQDEKNGGAWGDSSEASKKIPWCSVAMSEEAVGGVWGEVDLPTMVRDLADLGSCAAVIAIGQCASYGGYPGCKASMGKELAGFDVSKSQTGAVGVEEYLISHSAKTPKSSNKVINVPGCPVNPWWFVLTVVAYIVDVQNGYGQTPKKDGPLGIVDKDLKLKASALDYGRRLGIVYPGTIHGAKCPRFADYTTGKFAAVPGDPGCLQKLGCKGPMVRSLCGNHGWNAQQPENAALTKDHGLGEVTKGTHCTSAGHPCMACTERGYPDAYVPFVKR